MTIVRDKTVAGSKKEGKEENEREHGGKMVRRIRNK